MKVSSTSASSTAPAASGCSSSSRSVAADSSGPRLHTLSIEVCQMEAMMDVLTTVSRLGASMKRVHAAEGNIEILFTANPNIVARLPSLLESLVHVISVISMENPSH